MSAGNEDTYNGYPRVIHSEAKPSGVPSSSTAARRILFDTKSKIVKNRRTDNAAYRAKIKTEEYEINETKLLKKGLEPKPLGTRANHVIARRHIVASEALTEARDKKVRALDSARNSVGSEESKEALEEMIQAAYNALNRAWDKCCVADADYRGVMGLEEGLGEDDGPVPEGFSRDDVTAESKWRDMKRELDLLELEAETAKLEISRNE